MKSKVKKPKLKKDNLFRFAMVLLFVIVIVIVAIFMKKSNLEILENHNFYQYVASRKVEYEGTLTLTRKKNITELKFNDKVLELDSTPIYYSDKAAELLIPQDMALVSPLINGTMYKVDHFTNFYVENDSVYAKDGDNYRSVEKTFLYDGNDLYIFLDNIKLNVGNEEYELSPLSYVRVEYNNTIEVYDKVSDKYFEIDILNKEAFAKTDEYTINLNIDALKYKDKDQLLIKQINYLTNFSYEGGN